jgi:hypothetical protein
MGIPKAYAGPLALRPIQLGYGPLASGNGRFPLLSVDPSSTVIEAYHEVDMMFCRKCF